MITKVPKFKRCCCCIPLRYGLLFLSYVKLIGACIAVGFILSISMIPVQRVPIDFETLGLLFEIFMNIVFIVGGHEKKPKLVKVYYYYNIAILCLYFIPATICNTLETIYDITRNPHYSHPSLSDISIQLSSFGIVIALQIYFIFLIRSELRKLKNNDKFGFNNNAAEAECNIQDNAETYYNENVYKIAKVSFNDEKDDVIKNSNLNHEKDDKMNLDVAQLIKNVDIVV